jgi:membrane-associated phospholipid phosphatase
LWAVYILGFVLFAHLRTLADETGVATQFAYPIDVDEAMFFGQVPTIWLQEHFYTYGATGPLEVFTMPVYLSYFVVPHIVAFIIWRMYPQRFPVYVAAILAAVYLGLLMSFLVPTAPPWLAGQTGELPHVYRVLDDIGRSVSPGAYQQAYSTAGPNDVAAMPSLHTALPVVVAFAMWGTQRALSIAAIAYACAMGFTLVYLGEHYVADVIGGVLTGAVAWTAASTVYRRLTGRNAWA